MKFHLCYLPQTMSFRKLFLIVALFLIFPFSSHSFLVLRLNLEQLTSLSDRIFVGRCLEVKPAKDKGGRLVQYVTYEVTETLKGAPEERITFKQIRLGEGGERGDFTTTTAFSDLPNYEVGEENVIFLSGESDIGLTAPVGLLQGKFQIVTNAKGEKRVVNGLGNKGLFLGLSKSPRVKALTLSTRERKMMESASSTPSLQDFVSLVKKLVTD